ncbi:MAG: cell division ATP-binding protein FtsE [Deltaproteobacteria bacterium]|nr:MAG: cell division ATP-binding protein FtsE [Deltaproteobacteria bacterium]
MIRFFRVSKTYPGGVTALEDVSFTVAKGEFVFVTGPSGAGKTTLLKLMILAEHPDRGEILIDGLNITRLPPSKVPYLRRKVGFVFQDFKLLRDRTVFENVALPLEVAGYSPKRMEKRIRQVLRLVGLHDGYLGQFPPRLSGGEQQRVASARALINNPPILVADEPTGNLDPELTIEIMDLFEKTHRLGTTVIVATHDTSLVARYRKRAIALRKGRVVEG